MKNTLSPERWIQNYADYLFSYAAYRVNDREQAEDLVQETFLSAYKSRDQFKGQANEKTWLTSIIKNKIIDYYRSNARKNKVLINESDYTAFFQVENGHWNKESLPGRINLDGLDQLQQKELSKIIEKCMKLLPTIWSQIGKMKWLDDEKTDLICKAFDITPSNFWVNIHRAKLQMRDCIDKKLN